MKGSFGERETIKKIYESVGDGISKRIFASRNVIITGANRGIGRAILEKFADNGWNIWAHARRKNETFESDILQLSEKKHIWIRPVYFELGDETQIKEGMAEIFSDKKEIDAVVNNAGMGGCESFQRLSVRKTRELFDVNFFAPYQIMQLALRKMILQKKGAIVNMSSVASMDVASGDGAYGATKAALNILTKDVAAEVGKIGIRVNAVAPGPTGTDLMEKIYLTRLPESSILERIAMGRMATVQDIANVVYFLSTDDASFINGEIIRVDGGRK